MLVMWQILLIWILSDANLSELACELCATEMSSAATERTTCPAESLPRGGTEDW